VCNKLLNTARLGSICVLLICSSAFAMSQRQRADKEGAVRELISKWIDAYQHLDAKQVAKLETPDMETVDRFGGLHVPSGRDENERLWSDSFEVISANAKHPVVTIDHPDSFDQMSQSCKSFGDTRMEFCRWMASAFLLSRRPILLW
jgi:ketosteroid isomerase-like protein